MSECKNLPPWIVGYWRMIAEDGEQRECITVGGMVDFIKDHPGCSVRYVKSEAGMQMTD